MLYLFSLKAFAVISLPLVCSFGRMRTHLGLKESGRDRVPAETIAAVADVLRKSTVLKLSEDGNVSFIDGLVH